MKPQPLHLATILLVLSTILCPTQAAPKALVVSIADYSHHKGAESLPGTKKDALNMIAVLKETLGYPEKDILWIQDREATTEAILKSLETMAGEVAEGEPAFLYFTMH